MTILKFILRSFSFYKKKHFAVLLAVALSTMVLTGALMIGDSVKYSLQRMVEQRLGKTGFALRSADRRVSDELIRNLASELNLTVSGIIETNGVAVNPDKDLRLPQSSVYGVDSTFWKLSDHQITDLESNQAYLSENLAQRINADSGDFILLRLKVPQVIAINTPFSQEEETTLSLRVFVKGILSDEQFGRFSLKSDQKSPYNVFVSKTYLAQKFEMKGWVNQILVEYKEGVNVNDINQKIKQLWELKDLGIDIKSVNDKQLMLSSKQIFINEPLANAVKAYDANAQSVFTYLVNELKHEDKATPYSFVSGVQFDQSLDINSNQVIINEWLAKDLSLQVSDSVLIKYFAFGAFRNLEEKQKSFEVIAIEPNVGDVFNQSLMPEFPGLSEAGSCSEWDTGVPIDLDKIRKTDEVYWDEYKGTPKAIISIQTAKSLWQNEYGAETAFLLSSLANTKESLQEFLLQSLTVSEMGFDFQAVNSQGVKAASSGVDFGELFLSLSFFVIVAAIILLFVIYKLNLVSRSQELFSMQALGLSQNKIRSLVLAESSLPLLLGVLLGGLLGVYYNMLLIKALNTIWHDAVYTNALVYKFNGEKLMYGILSGVIVSLASIFFVLKSQLSKQFAIAPPDDIVRNKGSKIKLLQWVVTVMTMLGLIYVGFGQYGNPSLTLSLGFMVLVIGLWWFNSLLAYWSNANSESFSAKQFILKNLTINKGRSVLIVALLAIGVYTVLVTGANRKTFSGFENHPSSGTGGFEFWSEVSLPILYDINTEEGKSKLGMDDEPLIDSLSFILMNRLPGDDASCLNLNLVQQPAILGLNAFKLNERGSFSFAKLHPLVDSDKPWLFLDEKLEGKVVPVFLDQTVIQWGLMKKVGDTIVAVNEYGESLSLLIAGGLEASIFQGNILMGQSYFKKHFPSRGGAAVFLVDAPVNEPHVAKELLSLYLNDFGIELQSTAERLAQFNAVTNTYLNIFMLLGGLAVLIGTVGFGIVILRSLLERKKEIAILMAIGIQNKTIMRWFAVEYMFLLGASLLLGLLGALIGMLPTFFSESFDMPYQYLLILLGIIVFNGFLWVVSIVQIVVKQHNVKALKEE